jgi:purine-cytosine permease-like protein
MTQAPHQTIIEYEREPVPESARLGLRSFLGQYAGEHVAGTELMIGPLFVAAGVGAVDLIGGLLVGNLLAVLSWRFFTAPIATRARLTLYYQLEKICGRRLVTAYDVANGVMFTLLAGAMITVAATALGVWFRFTMPELTDTLPNSVGWVLAVLTTGALFSLLAAYGYKALARFANLAAPWMVAMFVALGLVGLHQIGIRSLREFWPAAQTILWNGGPPLAGRVKFTFWHVMFFAWFCNVAWHMGMADLSVLRYARRPAYALASAAGMYLGHFIAWIAASILYALQLKQDPTHTAVLPGPMAYRACGLAGVLLVVIAGWTTANPTLYRAGLAFQAISPGSSRFTVTLLTGLAATVTAVFPLVTMRLLEFVALWGMILMPMGAVIFMDFWVLPRLGLQANYAEATGLPINWAAALTWAVTVAGCVALVFRGGVQIFFVSLPGWFIAALLYVMLSALLQRRQPVPGQLRSAVSQPAQPVHAAGGASPQHLVPPRPIRHVAQVLSGLALAGVLLPPGLAFAGRLELEQAWAWMLAATVAWFASAPWWMDRKSSQ